LCPPSRVFIPLSSLLTPFLCLRLTSLLMQGQIRPNPTTPSPSPPPRRTSRDVDITGHPAYIGVMPILPCRHPERDGKSRRTAELIGELAETVTESRLRVLHLVRDEIPDIRRSRRRTRTTKIEKILVLRKRASSIHVVDREPIAVADAQRREIGSRKRVDIDRRSDARHAE